MLLHREKHPEHVEGCYTCKLLSVRLSAEATPTKQSSHYKQTSERDRSWPKDHDAYRRLRKDGIQPDHINGSAELEASL